MHTLSMTKALLLLLLSVIFYPTLQAQTITVSKYNSRYNSLSSGNQVAMPTAGAGTSRDTFLVQNTGGATLNLTGTPRVALSGANASHFSIIQPATSSLAAGASTYFIVLYNPTTSGLSAATATITSNSTTNATFTISLSGAGHSLYGPKWPPADNGTYQLANNGVEAGRVGGRTLTIGLVSMADKTTTYWAPSFDSSGVLGMKLSLDGGTYSQGEIFSYIAAESNLAAGKVVWRGKTFIQNAITFSTVPVFTRVTMTTTNLDGTVLPLVNPASIGLSEEVGGMVLLNNSSQYFRANFLMEAATGVGGPYTPYLNFYDAYPTPPGPLPGFGIGAAYSTINNGTYWLNTRPRLTNNQILNVNEGGTQTITTAFLNAADYEDLPLLPDSIKFVFQSVTSNSSPMVFNTGALKRSGVLLNKTDSFTLKDVQDNLITFTHDGSETNYDEFQFGVKDSKKLLALDGVSTNFNFKINIAPVNDAPVTRDTAFNASYLQPFSATLVGTDAENSPLSFSIVSQPAVGNVTINPVTGVFTYTPAGAPVGTVVTFTYRVNDGSLNSNTSTVTLTLINLPPSTQPLTLRTLEDVSVNGNLTGSDPEGTTVTFLVFAPPAKGVLNFNANGSFSYQPNLSKFGTDYFLFKAVDAQGGTSTADTAWIHIIPRMDEGNILIADKTRIHLVDPSTNQDTLLSRNGQLSEALNLYYKNNTSIFVTDQVGGLLKIHPYTGVQTLLASAASFNNNPGPLGIVLHPTAGYLAVADGPNGIRKVDTTTGVVTTMFSGGNLQFPTGVIYLSNGDLLVTDAGVFVGGASKIIRITPAGVQTVVATGGQIALPVDVALQDQNTAIVSDGGSMMGGTDKVYRVDLTSGVQTVISSAGIFGFPSGLDYFAKLSKLYVINQVNRKLVEVNPVSGVQTQLAMTGTLTEPFGLFVITAPVYVTSVDVPANNTYIIGNTLTFTVHFSDNVVVNTTGGVPTLSITIGSATVQATYVSGSGSNALVFSYVVLQGQLDSDGIAVNSLLLNGGSITNSGSDASLALVNIASTANVFVDGIRPTVSSVIRQNPVSAVTNGSTVTFRVNFSEAVKNVSTASFIITTTGSVTAAVASVSANTGNPVDVTVNITGGYGTVRLDVPASGTAITDVPGNPLDGGFNTGEEYIINHEPVFANAMVNWSVCKNATTAGIDSLFGVTDVDAGQNLVFTLITTPSNGTVSGLPANIASTGGTVNPSGIGYLPNNGFSGSDAFSVEVSDGISKDTIQVNVAVIGVSPSFTINNASQCVNTNSFLFTNTSTVSAGVIVAATWHFGDGGISSNNASTHTYTAAGSYNVKLFVFSSNGCTDSVTQVVTVNPKPSPSFTINNAAQCENTNSFLFTSTSTVAAGTITDTHWDFDDGTTSTNSTQAHIYNTAGTYNVKLVVVTDNGCTDSITKVVSVYPKPAPSFTINTTAQCVNANSFTFTGTSTVASGTITNTNWSFGDGGTSTSSSPTHVYAAEGSYNVKLVVITNNGCTDSITQVVTVYPKPTPSFTINSNAQCVNTNSFVFTSTSTVATGTITSATWNFGDGGTSLAPAPTHVYAAAGSYNVKLVVVTNNGCTDSITQVVTVNPKPTPSFSVNAAGQCLNTNSFAFTNTSAVTTGTIVSANWDFGDGGTSTASAPAHVYSTAGSYNVKLVVVTDNGCTDSITQLVTVYPKPAAGFTINANAQCVNTNSFVFTSTSTVATGTITSATWNFGDGGTSLAPAPTHVYAAAGSYSVKLVVVTNNGCTDSITQVVTVNPKPTPSFTINTAAQCLNTNSFAFTSTSTVATGNIASTNWDFGDGTSSSGTAPTYSYTAAGTYNVKLVVVTDNGCTDSITQVVTVYPKPAPSFTINTTAQCVNTNSFTFTGTSTVASGTITNTNWSFGDGGTSAASSPTHVYAAAGSYNVKLVVVTNNGCTDSITQVVTVYPKPVPSFTINTAAQCVNTNSFTFTSTSTVATGTINATYWSFGDGGSSSATAPTHTYAVAGAYNVKLVVVSDNGCTDSITQVVTVYPKPTPSFTINSTAQCLNTNNFVFTSTSTVTAGTIATTTWTFGDGSTSTTSTPTHVYAAAGSYNVKLVVVTNNGCTDSITQVVTVYPKPTPSFTVNTAAQCVNGNSFVFNSTSAVNSGSITSTTWDLGDGSNASGSSVSHTYTIAGIYNVKLLVVTNNGCRDSLTQPVTLYPKPTPAFSINHASQCVSTNSFEFTNTSTVASGAVVSTTWDLGDGSSSTASAPVHVYASAGTYNVKLVVVTDKGCTDSITQQVTVNATPVASFTINDSEQCLTGNSFVFTNTSPSLFGNNYNWTLGDGSTATSLNVTKAYTVADTLDVSLVAISTAGCSSNAVTQQVIIVANPVVKLGTDLTVLEETPTPLVPVQLQGTSLSYLWTPATYLDRVDTSVTISTPLEDILYTLTVTGEGGCTSSDNIFIKVLKKPVIPTAFSPNGDGVNDKWMIQYLNDYPEAIVEVFDRYGRRVYSAKGHNSGNAWNGTVNGKPLPIDTYYYIILPGNGRGKLTGFIYLLR